MTPTLQSSEPSLTEIREELQSVLSSVRFRQAPRLAKLLKYLCTSALVGDGEAVTEYTIAVDVLGKTQDFKEGKDAIVRVEVHRLRKRLNDFYEHEGLSHRLRIHIPTGKYTPEFRLQDGNAPPGQAAVLPVVGDSVPEKTAPNARDLEPAPNPWPWRLIWLTIASLAMLVGVGALVRPQAGSQLDAFWEPVLASGNQILLCIGNESGGHSHQIGENEPPGPMTLKEFHSAPNQMVHVADASALASFAGLMQAHGKRYRVVSQSDATYSDLQNSPVVLIGLLNNEWTRRLVGQLRFSVERPGQGRVIIRDHQNPSRSDWSIDFYKPMLDISKDYALVLRASDPKTEQMVIAAGGMSVFGTLAAAEFLTNVNEMRKLQSVAPKGWEHSNIEIVLETDVIRGHAGPPVIVSTHFW